MTEKHPFTDLTADQEKKLLQVGLKNLNTSLLKIAKFERVYRREQREKTRQRQTP